MCQAREGHWFGEIWRAGTQTNKQTTESLTIKHIEREINFYHEQNHFFSSWIPFNTTPTHSNCPRNWKMWWHKVPFCHAKKRSNILHVWLLNRNFVDIFCPNPRLLAQIGKTAVGLHCLQPKQALHLCQGTLSCNETKATSIIRGWKWKPDVY